MKESKEEARDRDYEEESQSRKEENLQLAGEEWENVAKNHRRTLRGLENKIKNND